MAKKHWYIPWDVNDWLADPAVCLLKPSTRAIWFDALCRMIQRQSDGELSGTIAELASLCRCTPSEMRLALDDLKLHEAADVKEESGVTSIANVTQNVTRETSRVTLRNRRLIRLAESRKSSKDRQKRYREKLRYADVTRHSNSNSNSKSTSYSSASGVPPPREPPAEKKPRQPDPIWDFVCAEWRMDAKVHAKRIGKICREFRALEATVDEIRQRAQRYRQQWRQAECTPEALIKHWGRFGGDQPNPSGLASRVGATAGKYSGVAVVVGDDDARNATLFEGRATLPESN